MAITVANTCAKVMSLKSIPDEATDAVSFVGLLWQRVLLSLQLFVASYFNADFYIVTGLTGSTGV